MNLGLRHAAVECTDLEKSIEFYRRWLSFLPYHVSDKDWAMLRLADTYLSLVRVEKKGLAKKSAAHPAHLGFMLSDRASVDELYSTMKKAGLKTEKPTDHRDKSYGFYLEDPDGNQLECIFIPSRD